MCVLISEHPSNSELENLRAYLRGKSEAERRTLLRGLTPSQRDRVIANRVVGKSAAVVTKSVPASANTVHVVRWQDVRRDNAGMSIDAAMSLADQANRLVAQRLDEQLATVARRVVDRIGDVLGA